MPKTASTLTSIFDHPRFKWVDMIASTVQEKAGGLLRTEPFGPELKSLLNGTPLRHRLHPMLVDVPVGAWTTACYLDALSTLTNGRRKRQFQEGADAAIALGIIGSLPAALTGMADWVDVSGKPRRYGMIHALLNVTALAGYSVSLAARRGDSRNQALALTSAGIGFAAMSLSASIGGDLVYNLGVNVPGRPGLSPPEEFTYVLDSSNLPPGGQRMVKAGDLPVLLVRDDDGELHALEHWCTHAGAPLSEAEIENGVITCHWHGSQFCVADGAPMRGPAATPLTVYAVREEAGRIMVGPPA